MADNSVTIALKLDTSQFNAQLADVKRQFSGLGNMSGGGRSNARSSESELTKTSKSLNKFHKDVESFVVRFTSMLRGNLSPSNVLGVTKSGQDVLRGLVPKGAPTGSAALAGVEGIGAEGAAAAAASTAAAGGGGLLGASIAQVIGLLIGIAAVLAAIAAGIALLIVGVSAVSIAFKPILKVLQAIGKVIGAALLPIAMVLTTLLAPLIWVMLPFVRLMNVVFRPVRLLLAQFLAGSMALIKSGNIGSIIGGVFAAIGPALSSLGTEISNIVMPLLRRLGEWVVSFLTMDITQVHNVVNNLFGKKLGDVLNVFINVLYFGISALAGFISQIAGKEQFNSVFGAGKFDEITSTNKAFKIGGGLAKILQDIGNIFLALLAVLQGDPPDKLWKAIGTLFNDVKTTLGEMFAVLDGILVALPGGETIRSVFQTAIDAIESLSRIVTNVRISMFGMDGTSGFWSGLVSAVNTAVSAINFLAQAASEAASLLGGKSPSKPSATKENPKGTTITQSLVNSAWSTSPLKGVALGVNQALMYATGRVSDAVITPSGQVIQTSPQDYLFATKDPGSLAGGGMSTTINITVQGNVDDKTARFITDTVQREIAQQWRAIAR